MDRSTNWTRETGATTPALVHIQNCSQNGTTSVLLDRFLVTAPSLSSVNEDLKWTFLLHTYGLACLFFVLGFYTFFSILNLRSLISSRPFMSTINVFLCLLGASRAACLFIDPYNLREIMPKVIGSIMWDIGFPFVTSAFCLIQLAFSQLTQLKFGPEKLQRESCLSLVITSHFFFIIASDVALAFHNHYMAKYIVQIVFLVWSIFLYLTFLRAGYRIMNLLRTVPSSMLTRDNSTANQKGIMQLAMLAPYNNLATSVAAALVPTLLSPKLKPAENNECTVVTKEAEKNFKESQQIASRSDYREKESRVSMPMSTVPEVYVRPPTPTPSTANLPLITVSSPSRRSSLVSRRGSDVSRTSRRNSECSVRFTNDDNISIASDRRSAEGSPRYSPDVDRARSPDSAISQIHSENVTPTGSSKELRRCSDFSHEKNRSSQFATKLRRNSDFGNRTPRRMLPPPEQGRLPKVMDLSPVGSRRNSDIGFVSIKSDSRRNSDIGSRRNSELMQVKPLNVNRRSSDISIRTLDKSPTHFQSIVPEKSEVLEKSESDSDQPDCNEKAALMTDKAHHQEDGKTRKKSLSWKNEKIVEGVEDITVEASLLPENMNTAGRVTGNDFTLHSILNHIAYVNRAKSDTPLHISEANTAAVRRSQIRKVLNVTYATAILGIILCISDIARIFGPYGLLAETVKYGTRPTADQYPLPRPWLLYQTFCRIIELVMGCAMASITKQPSVSPRHQYLSSYPNYNFRIKQRNGLYI